MTKTTKVTYTAGGPVGEVRKLDKLRPNPLNPRTVDANDQGIDELADSIRTKGLLQPLIILPDGTIVAGHRRWVAAKRAGLTHVPVIVRELDETTQIEAMLVENLQRKALNPVEAARACGALRERGLTQEQIATRTGLGKGTVAKYLQVVEMPADIQRQLAEYEISLSYIPHLAKLGDDADRRAICAEAAREGWLTWEVEAAVNRRLGRADRKPAPTKAEAPRRAGPARAGAAEVDPLAVASTDPEQRLLQLLTDAITIVRRSPKLLQRLPVRDCFDSLAAAARDAMRRAA